MQRGRLNDVKLQLDFKVNQVDTFHLLHEFDKIKLNSFREFKQNKKIPKVLGINNITQKK